MKIFMWNNLLCLTYRMIHKKMEDFFILNGCRIVADKNDADWILIGSCGSFFEEIERNYAAIDDFSRSKAKLAVYGCLPRITPARFRSVKDKVHLYINTDRPGDAEKMLDTVVVPWNNLPEPRGFRQQDYHLVDTTRTFIIAQYGCNANCNFCPHVIGIGPQKSLPVETVINEFKWHLADGKKTFILEGRDLGGWGSDFSPASTFPHLLRSILQLEGDFALHINQLGGNWAVRYQQELAALFADPRIKDIHVPVQTVCDRVLKLMGREPGVAELTSLLESFKNLSGRVTRTDMLIGFPTETEEEFQANLEFMLKWFDEIACYGFELHPNTPIAKMGLPFHTPDVINRRVEQTIDAIRQRGNIVWHRGGQVPETMHEREESKKSLKRT